MSSPRVEARISSRTANSARLSVRVEAPEGGISINDILARVVKGKLHVTFPLGRDQRPCVYLRGDLKQAVNAAIEAAFYQGVEEAGT